MRLCAVLISYAKGRREGPYPASDGLYDGSVPKTAIIDPRYDLVHRIKRRRDTRQRGSSLTENGRQAATMLKNHEYP